MSQASIGINSVVTIFALTIAITVSGCAGMKTASRQPVQGASYPLVQSMYAPEPSESCAVLGNEACSYLTNPLKSLLSSQAQAEIDGCVAAVLPKATADNANYIYVDVPNAVGGINLSSPKATWYKCSNLQN
jgi:hypothetical protein